MENMSKYMRIGIFGFFGGVALGAFFSIGVWAAFFVAFIAFFVLGVSRLFAGTKPSIFGISLSLALFFFAFGMMRVETSPSRGDSLVKDLLGKPVVMEGVIVTEPDIRENAVHLVAEIDRAEKILLIVKRYPEFYYGDRVLVSGKLAAPKNFEGDNGRAFDYIAYLEKDGIFSQMNFPHIEVVSREEGNVLMSSLFSIKHAFLDRVSRVLPEPHASLLGGLLISGLAFLPARLRAASGIVGIAFFALMTGAGAATVRASLMAGLVIFARTTGRTGDMLHLLFIAGFAMVLWNPHILLHDPSFQLSFLATLGLLFLSEKISARLELVPKKFLLREIAAATLATQIFVLPLLLYQTGNLSLVALPANLFILSAIPGAMFFGFLTGVSGFLFTWSAMFFGGITYVFLAYILVAVNFFSHLPFASVTVPEFPVWALFGAYVLLGIFIWRQQKSSEKISE
ncbi:MAG: ComEC family competence protein [Parcubacteria group bacterium]|nr:ComEC family competence protein [Parcubacteria group bacterium]